MLNLFLFFLFIIIFYCFMFVIWKLLSINLSQYSIIAFALCIFILFQSVSIKYNFFESLNEVLFIYMWWYFIFSTYGLYKREHELRLLEPIKFSLFPTYFYKLIKRSIKIRYLVLKELFLSFSLRESLVIGLIFVLSYAGLRILRALLVYEIIVRFGLDLILSKYLTVCLVCVSEVVYMIINVSKKIINGCKRIVIEEIRNILLNKEIYEYMMLKKIPEEKVEKEVGLKELMNSILQMKRMSNHIHPVIKGRFPHINVWDNRDRKSKVIELAELVISSPKNIISQTELDQISPKERQALGLESKSGVPLFNLNTGFPQFILSKTGKAVCNFEDSGSYINSENGFILFDNHLNVDQLKANQGLYDIADRFAHFHNNRAEIQPVFKYQKLHQRYLEKGKKMMGQGAFDNYNKYKDESEIANYFDAIKEFEFDIMTNVYPQTKFLFKMDEQMNFQQFLYEGTIFLSIQNYNNGFSLKILPTNGLYNEFDMNLINKETKQSLSLQLKTVTTTKQQYLKNTIDDNILRYKPELQDKDHKPVTDLLVVSANGGHVVFDLNENLKSQDKQRFFTSSICELNKTLGLAVRQLYIPDIKYNTPQIVELRKTIELHKELKTHYINDEHCIKPSSIKKNKFNDVD